MKGKCLSIEIKVRIGNGVWKKDKLFPEALQASFHEIKV